MENGTEGYVLEFPTPEQLWNKIYSDPSADEAGENELGVKKFSAVPFEDMGGARTARYYQEIAVNKALEAIAQKKNRILLTLATGTGKTFIAFQIVWKLFHSRWNLKRDGMRRPREVLFLADRNILA